MITVRRLGLGSGFRYLMESVAAGDQAAAPGMPLAQYYAATGTPPGVFLGGGLKALNDGEGVPSGSVVTEEHLWRMLGVMADPITGEPLGTTPRVGLKTAPVAGFDLTFSPVKSVSTIWALADEPTKQVIYDCHRRAIEYVLEYAEREVFHSRSGTNGIVQEDIDGIIAVGFTHWDSRSGDPQLHDHVVVWNRARTTSDGRWRTLDSRGVYRSTVALSEMHTGVLADYLTESLGVGWESRRRRHSVRPRWEIAGVPEKLLAEFSQRNDQVEARKDELVTQFVLSVGRRPTTVEVLEMRRRATILTRPEKRHRALIGMTSDWHQRASGHISGDLGAWVESLKGRNDLPLLQADALTRGMLDDAATAVVHAVAERRSTYSRANLLAEAHRLIQGIRFVSPDDRVIVAGRVVDLAVSKSMDLSPPEPCHTPQLLRRPDGTSRLRPKDYETYTSPGLFEAESRLIEAGHDVNGPVVSIGTVATLTALPLPGRSLTLSLDQALAVEKIATSGRTLDLLVGPAGTGKSTTMAALRAVWEAEHGPGSVVGLAPSAAAAEVLADELGIDTENTAKWLLEHRRLPELLAQRDALAKRARAAVRPPPVILKRVAEIEGEIDRWRLTPGQLLIIDEASLAGTHSLDQIVCAVADAGAKVLLVGDWAQLNGVEAGGAFSLLARDRGSSLPELSDVRRFRTGWERSATVALRRRDESAIEAYFDHGRVVEGDRQQVLDSAYGAWRSDTEAGLTSLMLAGDGGTVAELNRRARADLVASGHVSEAAVSIAGWMHAGVGDSIVTRQNDRKLSAGPARWVKNGDRWTVAALGPDGSITATRQGSSIQVILPAAYVAEHVELAYASTAHRAQGRTVDTAHAIVSPLTSHEALYVVTTRGRHRNHLYVDVHYDPDPATGHPASHPLEDGRQVLLRILATPSTDLSAHDTLAQNRYSAMCWANLCVEYQTIATLAQAHRWDHLVRSSGLTQIRADAVARSPAKGALHTALRDAEAMGLDVAVGLPKLVAEGPLLTADDPAMVLHSRVRDWMAREGRSSARPDGLIAGLVPKAVGVVDPDLALALTQRADALVRRANELAWRAIRDRPPWLRRLGPQPVDARANKAWMDAIVTLSGYRERWSLGSDPRPLGPEQVPTSEQLEQRNRARAALNSALSFDRTALTPATTEAAAVALQATVPARGVEP